MTENLAYHYLITPDFLVDKNAFLAALEASLQNGIKLVQFRSKQLLLGDYKELAQDVVALSHSYQAKVLLNGPAILLNEIPADGIHFPSSMLMAVTQRPVSSQHLFSVACHNAAQLEYGALMKADFATLSPVFATPSSPKGVPLGWDGFAELSQKASLPIFALGGLNQQDLPIAQRAGAYGIAAKRAFWHLQQPLTPCK